jgi:hypothetical protein
MYAGNYILFFQKEEENGIFHMYMIALPLQPFPTYSQNFFELTKPFPIYSQNKKNLIKRSFPSS